MLSISMVTSFHIDFSAAETSLVNLVPNLGVVLGMRQTCSCIWTASWVNRQSITRSLNMYNIIDLQCISRWVVAHLSSMQNSRLYPYIHAVGMVCYLQILRFKISECISWCCMPVCIYLTWVMNLGQTYLVGWAYILVLKVMSFVLHQLVQFTSSQCNNVL